MPDIKRVVPALGRHHRGFFLVVTGEMIAHTLLGIDVFTSRRALLTLSAARGGEVPEMVWGGAHLVMAGLLLTGLYASKVWLRVGLLGSVSVYLSGASALLIQDHASPLGAMFTFAGLVSVAGFFEPVENPASYPRPPDARTRSTDAP